jgi:hypothetical protein
MKKLLFVILILFCISCEKDKFDPNSPKVETFVQQIKNGTYDFYEKDENGNALWLIMPKFTKMDIQKLITLSNDTSHVEIFPTNPISSRPPQPEGRDYFILGECLLWVVEGIRNGTGYGSLDPYLVKDNDENHSDINGSEVLIVRDYYQEWWNKYEDKNWTNINPLEGKPYRWF